MAFLRGAGLGTSLALILLLGACGGPGTAARSAAPTPRPSSPAGPVATPAALAVTPPLPVPTAATAGPATAGPAGSTATGSPGVARGRAAVPNFAHVFLIVLENRSFGQVSRAPTFAYLNRLGASATVATNYYAISHPSLPNYLALLGGSTFGIESDCTTCSVSGPNLADQLDTAGKTWKAYIEDLPGVCSSLPQASGGYAKKHNPFFYFTDIAEQPQRCDRVVPLGELTADLAANRAPDFAWITPNLCHDLHNCTDAEGDAWLASFVPALLQSKAMADHGVLFITFDEGSDNASDGCCHLAAAGRVFTVVAGPLARSGAAVAVAYDHYSLLRTIEDAWALPHLAGAADPATVSMAACFGPS